MNLLKGKKSGITLIEALIVIALGIGLIAAGLVLFSSGQNTNKVKEETSNIGQIYTKISSIYQSDEVPTTLHNDAIAAGVFGKSLKLVTAATGTPASRVQNSWEGSVLLTRVTPLSYTLTYSNVPEGQPCVDLVNATRKSGFKRMDINSAGVQLISAMTQNSIITACENGTNDVVTIVWYNTNA